MKCFLAILVIHFLAAVVVVMGSTEGKPLIYIPFDELHDGVIEASPTNFKVSPAATTVEGKYGNAVKTNEGDFCIEPEIYDPTSCPFDLSACTQGVTTSIWLSLSEENYVYDELYRFQYFDVKVEMTAGRSFRVHIIDYDSEEGYDCINSDLSNFSWWNVVIVYEKYKFLKVYQDGTEIFCEVFQLEYSGSGAPFRLGCSENPTKGSMTVDDFRLYGRTFTDEEVMNLFQEEIAESNKPGDIRLAEGPNACTGRAEIFMNGTWGTICTTGSSLSRWPLAFCKTLGCNGILAAGSCKKYGCIPEEDMPIHIKGPRCDGRRVSSFSECDNRSNMKCGHSRDMWIVCGEA